MPTDFLNIPPEVRNQIYELVLLQHDPICPLVKNPWQELNLGLLRTNKALSREASSLFYSQNCFDFTACNPMDMSFFLEKVGRNNAGCIQRVLIDFPSFLCLDLDDITLEDESIAICTNIKSNCANLNTLTTSIESTIAMEERLKTLNNPKIITKALDIIDAHFRSILSLKEIVVDVYEDELSDHIRSEMMNRGWTISLRRYMEEVDFDDRSFGGFEEDDYNYNSGYDNDEYDIDNDSDFWRRAAD